MVDKRKETEAGALLKIPKLFGFGKKKSEKKTEEDIFYPLDKAEENWKAAIRYYDSEQYDQATIHFRQFLEMLLRTNCRGYVSSSDKNLTSLAKKAFHEIPAEISDALIFINPHYTFVKSVYSAAFADNVYEKTKMVAEWVFAQSTFSFKLDPK